MVCTHCLEDLLITERQGIEIDYCQKCRGVRLDRGQLNKIIRHRRHRMMVRYTLRIPSPSPSC